MTIVSGLKWDKDLLSKSSRLYKEQAITIESLVMFLSVIAYCSINALSTSHFYIHYGNSVL